MRIKTAMCLGGGVIGAGWAARLAQNGVNTVVCDPDPDCARKVAETAQNARRVWDKLTLAPLGDGGDITVTEDWREAAAAADFIQESLPEKEDLKTTVLAEVSAVAKDEALIASSTSGLLPSRLQAKMHRPERFCVGHPFNPVYLLPLVEVCGGQKTDPDTVRRVCNFYASLGMHPLPLRAEIDGFIADRLMEALWREALWLVHDDIATTGEVDDAVRYGCGLRWAQMGSFGVFHLGGGDSGMRGFIEQFAPALKLPWTKLTEVPEMTPAFADKIVAQCEAQHGGASMNELRQRRDDCLAGILQALRGCDAGAGALLKKREEFLYARAHGRVISDADDLSRPLRLHETSVAAAWVDYNGHLTESRYLQIFGDASDALFAYLGVDADYRRAGLSFYTAETHIMHRREAGENEKLYTATQVLSGDPKRLHVFHSLYRRADDVLLASAEQMLLHVNTALGRVQAMPEAIRLRAEKIVAAHKNLPPPSAAGRVVGDRI